jgi:hypothetical protein
MSDILEAAEQSAIASTLLSPREQAAEYADQHPEFAHLQHDYAEADQFAESPQDALEQPEEGAQQEGDDLAAEVTPEHQEAFLQAQEAFESLPETEQFEQCTEFLSTQYAEAQAQLDPQTCNEWAEKLVAEHGFPGLEKAFDATALATVAEVASNNFEQTLSLHPAAPAFREAAGKYFALPPEQRESTEGQRLYSAAVRSAIPLSSRAMAQAVLSDLGTVLRAPGLARTANPQMLVAQLVMDIAEDAGWVGQGRQQAAQYDSPFATNADLFDAEAMEEVARRGLL